MIEIENVYIYKLYTNCTTIGNIVLERTDIMCHNDLLACIRPRKKGRYFVATDLRHA